jgi:hypothetical protein
VVFQIVASVLCGIEFRAALLLWVSSLIFILAHVKLDVLAWWFAEALNVFGV